MDKPETAAGSPNAASSPARATWRRPELSLLNAGDAENTPLAATDATEAGRS